MGAAYNETVEIEGVEIDFSTHRIIREGHVYNIEPKVMQVLFALYDKRPSVVPRDDIKEIVWQQTHGHEQGVTRAIHILRHALGDEKGKIRFLETIPKKGYRFIAAPNTDIGWDDKQPAKKTTCLPENEASHEQNALSEAPQIREQTTNKPKWITAMVLAFAFVITGLISTNLFFFSSSKAANVPTDEPVDRRVIQSVLSILVQNDRPADLAMTALIKTQNFDKAIELLKRDYLRNQSQYSISQSIDILHQIGAMAFNPEPETALKAYREIVALDQRDWLAEYQLARLHFSRGESAEAKRYINRALQHPDVARKSALDMQITQTRIEFTELDEAAFYLHDLANKARAEGYDEIWARASVLAVSFERQAINRTPNRDYSPLSAKLSLLEEAIEYQISNNLDDRTSVSLSVLADVQNALQMYEEAEQTNLRALEIENIIRRPSLLHTLLSNLTINNFNQGDYVEAKAYNEQAFEVLRASGKFGDVGFNFMMSAKIAKKTGHEEEACRQMDKSLRSFDPAPEIQAQLLEIEAELGCR